nr:hypothetical protein [Tanacetum cinerariifolium]
MLKILKPICIGNSKNSPHGMVNHLNRITQEWQSFVTLVNQSQELKTVSYHKLYDILKQHQNEVNEIRAERLARTVNPLALVAQQQPVYHPQNHPTHYTQNSSTRAQQVATRNRGKAIINSPPPIYDQEPSMVAEDDEMSKDKEIDKLMALISLSFKKIYKPTNNNLQTSSNTSRENKDNSPRISRGTGMIMKARECQKPKWAKDAAYHKEKMLLCKQEEAGFQLNVEQADWKDDTDDEPKDQELEAHYMYMAEIQEVNQDAADDSGPIFDSEPLQKVPNNDNYNVFATESEHPEQSKSVNDAYPIEHDEHNVIIDSMDISYDREQVDQDDDDDLANERDLLASLIMKLKCKIDDNKNHNKFLETSNKDLVDNLKGEIEDFKNKNKSLESLNNHFKEANNELSKTNQLMYKDLKKFQAELDRHNDVKYTSKVKINCAKAKGDLMSYKMESKKSFNAYTQKINDLNQTISEMKKELFAHQETMSILSQAKEAQLKFYKTREDKKIDKVIVLENKIKDLDNIVYKTGQSVQIINMLNRNCKTCFAKPEFLKKGQRANPRLKVKNDKSFKENQSKEFRKEREQYFEIQDLKAQLQDKEIAINSLKRKDCSKSKSVTKNNESNDFSKPVTAHILPSNNKSKNTNVLALGMYKLHTAPIQTRTTQLPHDFRKTNKRVSFSTGVISPTSFSRPQLKSNRMEDRVMLNNSQGKKQEEEDHHRNVKFSKNKTSVTACNDSLNAKTSNVHFVYATYGKYVLNVKHDMCVLNSLNGVNSRTKIPIAVPVSTREPKRIVNQSVAKPLRRTVALESTNQKPRHTTRKLYEHVRIDNDIYSTVDACPNACEMWKAIERLKQGESINVQDLETNLYWEFGNSHHGMFLLQLQPEWQRFLTLVKQSQELKTVSYHKLYDILKQHQNEVNKLRIERIARIANLLALVAQQPVYHPHNHPTHYTQNSSTRLQQAATRNKGKAIVNSPLPIYDQEPSMVAEDNEMLGNVAGARETIGTMMVQKFKIQCYNCKEFRHVAKECQKTKRAKDAAYHMEKMLLSHYIYMAQTKEVSPDAADSVPIFDTEPLQKNDDNDDDDLTNECELLVSLIEKLKCKINNSKNHNKFFETSNKVLVDKLKGEIEDFKNKNTSLESSKNRFKEANHKLSKTNALMYTDLKKFKAELDKCNDVKYVSKMEIDCAKAKGDLISYKMES